MTIKHKIPNSLNLHFYRHRSLVLENFCHNFLLVFSVLLSILTIPKQQTYATPLIDAHSTRFQAQANAPLLLEPQGQPLNSSINSNQQDAAHLIPAGSGIVAKTLQSITLDPERKYALPITMVTIVPIFDRNGQPIIPPSTLITCRIEKRDSGDEIFIESILYRGRVINLQTVGRLIPAQIKPENYGQYVVPPKSQLSSIFDSFGNSLFTGALLGVALSNTDRSGNQTVTPLLISVLGIDLIFRGVAAVTDNPPQKIPPLVDIPENSILVFALKNDLLLPDIPAQDTPLPNTSGQN